MIIKAGIHPTDPIEVFFNINEKDELFHVIHNQKSFIQNGIGVPFSFYHLKPYYIITIKEDNVEVNKKKFFFYIIINNNRLEIQKLEFV